MAKPYFNVQLEKLTASAGRPAMVIDDVAPNPDFDLLGAQAMRFRSLKAQREVFVAIGGGSVIDTAKVLASAKGDFEQVKTFLLSKTGEENIGNTPIIAVPTTSGTGSEVTCWGTVWNNASENKYSLNRQVLYPQHAVIDPELMLAKPRGLTISTGLDALSHALESLWNINVTPDSAECAVSAAAEILDVLPKLAENLNSLELRSRMAAAALMSGIACSFTLPIVLQCVADEGGLRGTSLRRIFGTDLAAGAQTLSDFLHTLGVSTHPKDHGPNQREWRSLVDAAFSGERGQNFVGTRKNFHLAACALGIV